MRPVFQMLTLFFFTAALFFNGEAVKAVKAENQNNAQNNAQNSTQNNVQSSTLKTSQKDAFSGLQSPYGVHSHMYHPWEWKHFPKNLDVMRAAGIQWMRTDFLWDHVEKQPGVWNFEQYDRIVEEAQKRGVHVLGILGYSTPWARPAWEHPEEWKEYVTRTVGHYRGRVSHWEVWNEENISAFWKNPNPEDYVRFLKLTAEAARAADPETTILFGGTAEIPYDYIEKCLQLGAGEWFDVMNIHPYREVFMTDASVQNFRNEIQKTQELLKKYGLGEMPVWITEMGWTDYQREPGYCPQFISAVLAHISPKQKVKKVTFLHDPEHYAPSRSVRFSKLKELLPPDLEADSITLAKLSELNPKETPFLIMPPNESFPSPYFDAIYAYVRDGGTLFFLNGFPCYYSTEEKGGVCERTPGEGGAESCRERLRIEIRAWWTHSGVPKKADSVTPAPSENPFFPTLKTESAPTADRFPGKALLKNGDEMIPILIGKTDSFEEPAAVLYRFHSDLTGNIAVYTLYDAAASTHRVTTEEMGIYLPQAYLLAFSAGIERFFTYQFQAIETSPTDPEHHFGLVHSDLSPKPGYSALRVLSNARPAGSVHISETIQDGTVILSWRRPDAQRGWALWRPGLPSPVNFRFTGNAADTYDYLGNFIRFPQENGGTLELSEKILYIIGPEELKIEPLPIR